MSKKAVSKIACIIYIAFWIAIPGLPLNNSNTTFILSETFSVTKKQQNNEFFEYLTRGQPVKTIYIKRGMEDKRVAALEIFLRNHNSPLADYAEVFVEEADRYGFDWRLSPAIAILETGGGRLAPKNKAGEITYNAWGWREGGDWKKFASWDDGIRYIAHRFANGYGLKRLNPKIMEASYCGTCHETSPGKWASGVIQYMNQMQAVYDTL